MLRDMRRRQAGAMAGAALLSRQCRRRSQVKALEAHSGARRLPSLLRVWCMLCQHTQRPQRPSAQHSESKLLLDPCRRLRARRVQRWERGEPPHPRPRAPPAHTARLARPRPSWAPECAGAPACACPQPAAAMRLLTAAFQSVTALAIVRLRPAQAALGAAPGTSMRALPAARAGRRGLELRVACSDAPCRRQWQTGPRARAHACQAPAERRSRRSPRTPGPPRRDRPGGARAGAPDRRPRRSHAARRRRPPGRAERPSGRGMSTPARWERLLARDVVGLGAGLPHDMLSYQHAAQWATETNVHLACDLMSSQVHPVFLSFGLPRHAACALTYQTHRYGARRAVHMRARIDRAAMPMRLG